MDYDEDYDEEIFYVDEPVWVYVRGDSKGRGVGKYQHCDFKFHKPWYTWRGKLDADKVSTVKKNFEKKYPGLKLFRYINETALPVPWTKDEPMVRQGCKARKSRVKKTIRIIK
jgi:hypothetical protein